MKPTGPTNALVRRLARMLRKVARENKAPAWLRVAEEIEKPRRRRVAVNLSKINRYASNGDFVVVPGKVLGVGSIAGKTLTIAALSASATALAKIKSSGCQFLTLEEAVRVNPEARNVKLIV
ncbi:MAG: 50S ribosomal protein L18e [Acidilobaceae archaeon]